MRAANRRHHSSVVAYNNTYDTSMLEGWGIRQYNWEFSASIQRELIPRVGLNVGAFQSVPGPSLAANFNVPNALVAPSLGRNLAGNAANVAVNLVKPGTLYGDRTNQLDFRVAKVLSFGRTRTNIGVDLYDALSANPVTAYNQTFGARWLTPTQIMPARFVKLSVQVDW